MTKVTSAEGQRGRGPRSRRLRGMLRWLGAALGRGPLLGPAQAQLGIADACDLRCRFCRYWAHDSWKPGQERLMPPALAGRILRTLVEEGLAAVEVCGRGEPLLNPHCLDILQTARDLGLDVSLVTNGRQLLRHDLEWLMRMGLSGANISVDAASAETYLAVHEGASEAAWDTVVEGIEALVKARQATGNAVTSITLSMAVCRLTADDPQRLVTLARALGATGVAFFPAALYPGMDDLVLTAEGRAQAVASAQGAAREAARGGLAHNVDQFLAMMTVPDVHYHAREIIRRVPCYAAYFFTQIGADGSVYPCCACDRPVGRTEGANWAAVWRSPEYAEFRRAALRIPSRGAPPHRCHCESCFYAWTNAKIHARLRPWNRA